MADSVVFRRRESVRNTDGFSGSDAVPATFLDRCQTMGSVLRDSVGL